MRKMGSKRFLSLVLVTALTGCLFTACGKTNEKPVDKTETNQQQENSKGDSQSQEASKKEIKFPLTDSPEITMLAPTFNSFTFDKARVWQYLNEKYNINWKVQEVDKSVMSEKKSLLLSTNQYPDVLYKCNVTQTEIDEQASLGTFIPLDDLIKEYAPNLQKILDSNPIVNERVRSEDGHIYSLPMIVPPDPQITCTWLNMKWLDNLGLKKPTNTDELYNVLKAFKEQDANKDGDPNNEIPFTSVSNITFNNFMPYFGVTVDRGTNTTIIDDKITYVPTMEQYKDMIRYVSKLYKEGLMDKNTFSQSQDQLKAQAYGNDNYGLLLLGRAQIITDEEVSLQYDALEPFADGNIYVGSGVTPGTLVITDKCKNPEIVMSWADYFYTEEGASLVWIGIKGESYDFDSNGNFIDLMEGKDRSSVQNVLLAGVPTPSNRPEELRKKAMPAWERHFQAERDRIQTLGKEVFPMLRLDKDQTQDIANIGATITPYVNEYFAKVVVGEYDLDSTWDEYVKNLKNMNLDEYVSIYQKAYDKSK